MDEIADLNQASSNQVSEQRKTPLPNQENTQLNSEQPVETEHSLDAEALSAITFCQNGHSLVDGELFCMMCGLTERAESVQKRIRENGLSVDESLLSKALFSKSRRALDEEWQRKRAAFPDSDHEALLPLLQRKDLTPDDLIILLSTSPAHFIPTEQVVASAAKLATQVFGKRSKASPLKGTEFDREAAAEWLKLSRPQIYEEIDTRILGFARCGNELIDTWADTYRLEKHMSLERCLVLLAVPTDKWLQLPKQQYITEILKFGERRIMATINQGPLVYLRTGRNSSTLDMIELGTTKIGAERILDQLVTRNAAEIEINPALFEASPSLERRIRGLVQKTTIFKRDTGKHGLFLGFPVVAMRAHTNDEKKTKLRVAPILLFPVRIIAELGNKGKIALANSDSDEIRLNPALAGILELTPKDEEKWREALDEILNCEHITPKAILYKFSQLCDSTDAEFTSLPGKEFVDELDKKVLSSSAALFHCDFAGKAVADDLRNICGQSISGTALELALRVAAAADAEIEEVPQPVSSFDIDDYAVIAADPSQEIAVQQSRLPKGLHIEGPPGTGKSQTIVNIIADCVARNETVLVVCQKQAALSVVEKRLKAEGLGRRLFYITDISKDRQSVVRALREQLDERNAGHGSPVSQLRKDRGSLMARLQTIDAELNKHHSSFQDVDEKIGLSYRSILSELIKIEAAGIIKLPSLRTLIKDFDNAEVTALAEECASIANLWLESKFEISPLQDLKLFSPDTHDAQLIMSEFMRFMSAEEYRFKTLLEHPKSAEVDDITIYVSWLKENEDFIREIPKEVRLNLSRWVGNFFPADESRSSPGSEAINKLMEISDALSKLDKRDQSVRLFEPISELKTEKLNKMIAMASSATSTGGFFSHINPVRLFNRYRMRKYLRWIEHTSGDKGMMEFLRAAILERELRKHRQTVQEIGTALSLDNCNQVFDLQRLQNFVSVLLTQLAPVAELSSKLRACPLAEDAKEFAKNGAFEEFNDVLKGVIKRHAAKTESLAKLTRLAEWFDEEWLQAQKKVISAGRGNIEASRHMQRYLHSIVPFQEFRLRSKTLSPIAMEIFALLRPFEAELKPGTELITALTPTLPFAAPRIPAAADSDLVSKIRRVIRREACLAWKSQLETKEPALTIAKEEINYKIKTLGESDDLLRKLNRKILAEPNPDAVIAPQKRWEDLTRLSGARARRLRELAANGPELGLMSLRPIWMMNPETASRLLPLTPGLFDVVIFDEASQLLVEYALPALFRAKRAIVSGDEKQMPPPNFFAARVQNDESFDLDEDEIDDMMPQAERDHLEEAWNRREIKDCPDLLNLASAVLPTRSLQIHYRSEFRELIAFSNSAFYSGTLSIPSKRPASEVRKARPIEVIQVNSIYEKQVNPGEAAKVAEILQQLWSVPAADRPTIGVVTFNLKQAQLIEETLENLAMRNASFKEAFEDESKRSEDGEDVGFFIKNLESVQGDERDIIIFSTTFGNDTSGAFRRNFGKLGQLGGERRLNVAITRAKRKVILLTSLPVEKISDYLSRSGSPNIPRDYVQAYMDYAAKVSNGTLEAAERCLGRLSASEDPRAGLDVDEEDPFIMNVAAYIRSLGYDAVTRQKDSNDAFNIDIAVENPRTGRFAIGIECDAPGHHLLTNAKHREIWRPTVLGKSIARIHRITSREWYQKQEREKELLREAIAQAFAQGDL